MLDAFYGRFGEKIGEIIFRALLFHQAIGEIDEKTWMLNGWFYFQIWNIGPKKNKPDREQPKSASHVKQKYAKGTPCFFLEKMQVQNNTTG